jgi:hypothetical protein
MADDNNQLFKEIDRSTIETCAGGYDSRPFNSKLYLNAPFNTEFLAALTWDESHNSSTSTANLVHVEGVAFIRGNILSKYNISWSFTS